jgi:hypothetical protein
MLTDAFTPRNVAKFVVTAIIAAKTSDYAEDAITEHTSLESDTLTVEIGSRVIGWFVADKLKPHTDMVVDKTADYVTAKREARNAKKNTTEEK